MMEGIRVFVRKKVNFAFGVDRVGYINDVGGEVPGWINATCEKVTTLIGIQKVLTWEFFVSSNVRC